MDDKLFAAANGDLNKLKLLSTAHVETNLRCLLGKQSLSRSSRPSLKIKNLPKWQNKGIVILIMIWCYIMLCRELSRITETMRRDFDKLKSMRWCQQQQKTSLIQFLFVCCCYFWKHSQVYVQVRNCSFVKLRHRHDRQTTIYGLTQLFWASAQLQC